MPTIRYLRVGPRYARPATVIGNVRPDIPARRNPDKTLVLAAYGAASVALGCCVWAHWFL